MADDEQGEKTEEATPHKLKEARKKGQVAFSKDLVASISLCAAVAGGVFGVPSMAFGLVELGRRGIQQSASGVMSVVDVEAAVHQTYVTIGPGLMAVLGTATFAGAVAGLAVTQFNFAVEALEPKPERLDVAKNFKSTFLSPTPWFNLGKSLAVGALICWSVYSACVEWMDWLPAVASWAPGIQLVFVGRITLSIFERALPLVVLIGIADLMYQKWKTAKDMMMSIQEVRRENKDQEGDPLVKQKRKARGRQLAMGRQLRDVATADVVVTNPTHFAVALRYRRDENPSPIVVARGADLIALRIRAEAVRHDVPVIENRALARSLVSKGKVGFAIPQEFYGPVAKVLAAVYRRRRRP